MAVAPMGAIFEGCHRARFSPHFYFLYLCYPWVLSLWGATGLDSRPIFIFYIYATHGCYLCGVPQGSILAPFLFSIFMLPMGAIFVGCHRARFSPQFYFLYLCYRWVLSLWGATGLDSRPIFIFYIYATDGCYLCGCHRARFSPHFYFLYLCYRWVLSLWGATGLDSRPIFIFYIYATDGCYLLWGATGLDSRPIFIFYIYATDGCYLCGVPQGSILTPVLFSIFMIPMGAIFVGCHRARFSPHFYILYLCYRWVLSLWGATGLDSHPSFIFYIYATDGCYLCGVPQGSILAPFLFSIFMLPMGAIFVGCHRARFSPQFYFLYLCYPWVLSLWGATGLDSHPIFIFYIYATDGCYLCGVPQGSILAPVLFSIFMLPMGAIFEKYGVSFHLYADDTLYFPLQHKSKEFLGSLLDCLNELQIRLKQNS